MKVYENTEEYIKAIRPEFLAEFERVRKLIKDLVPEANEVISYGIPTYKYKGRNMVHLGAFRDHLSLFPGSAPIEVFKDRLSGYKTAKGTIQFTPDHTLPDELVTDIVAASRAYIDQ
jgi:uncharacterized protein YdhG (YjbR/CyaY superfamily)